MNRADRISDPDLTDEWFGTGEDGDVTISSNTSLTRTMYYRYLTVNSGKVLNPVGFKIYCTQVLTNNGTIGHIGLDGEDGTGGGHGGGGGGFISYSG